VLFRRLVSGERPVEVDCTDSAYSRSGRYLERRLQELALIVGEQLGLTPRSISGGEWARFLVRSLSTTTV